MHAASAVVDEQIDGNYFEVVKEVSKGCSTDITPFVNPFRMAVEKDRRQGDPLSPCLLSELFTACL